MGCNGLGHQRRGSGRLGRRRRPIQKLNTTTRLATTDRNYRYRRRPVHLDLLALLISVSTRSTSAQDALFCGKSWSDASENCEERENCPNGLDEECSTPGHVCFGDTLCSAARGDGDKFKYKHLTALLDAEYNDISNSKFCGTWWLDAQERCSIETHCVDDSVCEGDDYCVATVCNVQGLLAETYGSDWRDEIRGQINGSKGQGGSGAMMPRLPSDDPSRNNFCGVSWGDASKSCEHWCAGEDDDCPGNLKCFAQTMCYYDEDLVPSASPLPRSETDAPTNPPLAYDDPANRSFCGVSFGDAIQKCSVDTSCRSNSDCNADAYEICHTDVPNCNLVDLVLEVEKAHTGDYFYEHSFCAATVFEAEKTCSIETHCGKTLRCDGFMICQYAPSCSITELLFNDKYGIVPGTVQPPSDPTDPKNFFFCGEHWSDVTARCSLETWCGLSRNCPKDQSCYDVSAFGWSCNAHYFTFPPSVSPTTYPPSRAPATYSPSPAPITDSPSLRPSVQPSLSKASHTPTDPIIYGVCATNLDHLKQIYQTDSAVECSTRNECIEAGYFCFYDVFYDVDYLATDTSSPSVSPIKYTLNLRPTRPIRTGKPSSSPLQLTEMPVPRETASAAPVLELVSDPPATGQPSSLAPTSHRPNSLQPTSHVPSSLQPSRAPTSTAPSQSPSPPPRYNQAANAKPPVQQKPAAKRGGFYCAATQQELETTCHKAKECASSKMCHQDEKCFEFHCSQDREDAPDESNFYCAESLNDLRRSCHNAVQCIHPQECLPNQGCIQFTEPCVSEGPIAHSLAEPVVVINPGTQINSDDNEENDEVTSQQHDELYSPALCEHGLVGFTAQGDCSMYWKCREGYFLVGSSAFCDSGLLFDKLSQQCVSEELVDRFCVGSVLLSSPTPTSTPIASDHAENVKTQSELCAPDFVGFRSNHDCTRFYDCNLGFFGSLHSCKSGFKLDRVRAVCISEELVDNNCFGPESHIKLDSNAIHSPLVIVTEHANIRPAKSEPSQKQPIIEVGAISNEPPDSHPKETETTAKDNGGHWVDLIRPKYDPSSEPTSSPSVGPKSFWKTTDSSPHGDENTNAWQWEIHQLNASMQIVLCNPFIIILASLIIHI